MAHNGGPRVPPRPPTLSVAGVHHVQSPTRSTPSTDAAPAAGGPVVGSARAPAAMSIVLPPVTAPLSPLGTRHHRPPRRVSPARSVTPTSPVTLSSPRPDKERLTNEYVEAPCTRPAIPGVPHPSPVGASTAPGSPPTTRPHKNTRPDTLVVTKQPHATFTKASQLRPGRALATTTTTGGSIICSDCGRCRCEQCREPRALPQRWVCDQKCLCSVDAVIDYASCLCCVKGLYYHCSKDYESDRDGDGTSCADEPCSCGPHRRALRWGCLLALTAALPCLLCYWPLRGCARCVEAAWARHMRAGCRCRPPAATTPEKRLLDASPDF